MTRINTVLLGYGKIGGLPTKHGVFECKLTHAGVIDKLEGFNLLGIVEPEKVARDVAVERHGKGVVFASIEEARDIISESTLIVDASPPKYRKENLEAVGIEKFFFIEKPTLLNFNDLVGFDSSRIFVNYWRRFVPAFRTLAERISSGYLGAIQYATVCYGNGLLNNGSHMADFAQMLLGDLGNVTWAKERRYNRLLPIEGDLDVDFLVESSTGFPVFFKSLDFKFFRENSLMIVFEKGEIEILSEGAIITERHIRPHSMLHDAMEMDYRVNRSTSVEVSNYLLWGYGCIYGALTGNGHNYSGVESAISSERIVLEARNIAQH